MIYSKQYQILTSPNYNNNIAIGNGGLTIGNTINTTNTKYLISYTDENGANKVTIGSEQSYFFEFPDVWATGMNYTLTITAVENGFISSVPSVIEVSMNRLNDFLAGRYMSALDVPAPERYLSGNDGNIVYRYLSEGRTCELELNAEALPVRWSMDGRWTLNIAYGDDGLPHKLDGTMDNGEETLRMVLLVKERRNADTLPDLSMKLDVPQNVAVYSLDQ